MAPSSFISSEQLYRQLNKAWRISGLVKALAIRLELDKPVMVNGQPVTVDVTHMTTTAESYELAEVLQQYHLIPVQPWTWLAKMPPDNTEPPLYVEWDPAALPPDADEPILYWTWDGHTVAPSAWYLGAWQIDLDGRAFPFNQANRMVLAWQPLHVPPGPEPRKDPA